MTNKVYITGELVDEGEAKISVFDHGLLYGDGVFEGIRAYGGEIFRCREHVDRLYDSARAIDLQVPIGKDDLVRAMRETMEANGLSDGYLRVIATRGTGTLGLDANLCEEPQLIIIAAAIQLYPEEFYQSGLEVITCGTVRNLPHAVDPRIKSLNYLNNILAKIEAHRAGVREAIMLNARGMVAECTGDNIFVVKDGQVLTPPVDAGILAGVTRQVVLDLAAEHDVPAAERSLSRYDVYTADECFLTGTAAELIPVVKVDGRQIGSGRPGPVTLELLELFRREVSENPNS
jgi:branched-chain amino acid aminotransferase